MPLTWDLGEIQDYENECFIKVEEDMPMRGLKAGESVLSPITNALIWHTLNVGMGAITPDSAPEFFARVKLVEMLYGASLRDAEGERPITMDDVRQHIGLKTNATYQQETRTKFLKRHADYFLTEQVAAFEKDTEA